MRVLSKLSISALLTASTLALAHSPLPLTQKPSTSPGPEIDVAFVLDTTSSMGGLLEGAKQKIWSIASNISRGQPHPHLKVALVAYRDLGDTYVAKRFDFTDDLDTVFEHLREFQAEGGGDAPEHVGRGLGEAVRNLEWSSQSKTMKTIFLVGDAPPADRHDDWNYKTWAKAAERRGIVVNTIRCGGDTETLRAWKEIASFSGGTVATIEQNGGVLAVATPYDDKLAELSGKIATKTLYAGERLARKKSIERRDDVSRLAPEAAADRASYGARGAGSGAPAPATGAVDLVSKPMALEKMSNSELPEELVGLDASAQKAKVETLAKERASLVAESKAMTEKRQAWLDAHAKDAGKAGGFDAEVMSAIRTQAQKSGIRY